MAPDCPHPTYPWLSTPRLPLSLPSDRVLPGILAEVLGWVSLDTGASLPRPRAWAYLLRRSGLPNLGLPDPKHQLPPGGHHGVWGPDQAGSQNRHLPRPRAVARQPRVAQARRPGCPARCLCVTLSRAPPSLPAYASLHAAAQCSAATAPAAGCMGSRRHLAGVCSPPTPLPEPNSRSPPPRRVVTHR